MEKGFFLRKKVLVEIEHFKVKKNHTHNLR